LVVQAAAASLENTGRATFVTNGPGNICRLLFHFLFCEYVRKKEIPPVVKCVISLFHKVWFVGLQRAEPIMDGKPLGGVLRSCLALIAFTSLAE
jgi:hypothetical protein